MSKKFKDKVGLIHGALEKEEKDKVLNKFLNNKIDILVSTTVIEVGIDFPNANVISYRKFKQIWFISTSSIKRAVLVEAFKSRLLVFCYIKKI